MFNYTIEELNSVQVIIFKGRILDQSHTTEFINKFNTLLNQGEKKFIIDFSEIDYINSAGLNVLITLLTKTRDNNGEFYICNIPIKVKRLIAISKLESIFKMEATLDDALQKLR